MTRMKVNPAFNPLLVILSANSEWKAARQFFPELSVGPTPFGECMQTALRQRSVIFLQGGWGKVSAAASCQYGLQRWQPQAVLNLGTCGGFAGRVNRGTILLVEETWIYDIYEQMGDAQTALQYYRCQLDLSSLKEPFPQPVRRGKLISADRDILSHEIEELIERYEAIAADWESGAISWVCRQNGVPCLILRGVSDLVSTEGGEAYGNPDLFHRSSVEIVHDLLGHLPEWMDAFLPPSD